MKIKPDEKVLFSWMNCYVPEKDLFFLSKEHLDYGIDFTDVLLMPKEEFYNHSTYRQVNYVNGYEYWNIKNADFVIIAEKEWIETIPKDMKRFLLNAQLQMGRGLVFPLSVVDDLADIPDSYLMDGHVVLQRFMWEKLDKSCKAQILTTVVYEWWDKGECEKPPESLPDFLKPHANSFAHSQGANCLAAVLFAISNGKQEWFIYEWLHQKTFLEKLKLYHYEELITEDLHQGDVVTWTDENGIIQHAAYHLGEELYFNKDGQTIFNPWKILSKEQLYREWGHLTIIKYRQM
ncbi:hypothetical protein JNUCC31_28040 [Paenibacillus sp. JNUCC31]|uniref:hypothetical protein n=1 Tax=Paenibacillus sp. JNUCC-31 TaxID=2777983 RepID=UPI00177CAB35|nr:hypothetical protein [Paenibacillus sp. JNUCC-31]QOS78516.1 hypothetical protein JNUCC31_28040 [Paenibacillus sp. JNUCC-31]